MSDSHSTLINSGSELVSPEDKLQCDGEGDLILNQSAE